MELFLGFGLIEIDFFYYAVLFFFGPVMFCYLFVFLPREKQLHRDYQRRGISTTGRVTETKEIGDDESQTYFIRFSYTSPETGEMYIKGFVEVSQAVLDRGRFTVLVLPGEPASGVPKYLIQDPSSFTCFEVFFMILSPLILCYSIAALTIWIEAPLFGSYNMSYLPMSIHDIVAATLLSLGAAYVPAYYIHAECAEQITGTVHLVEETTPLLVRDQDVSIPCDLSRGESVDDLEEQEDSTVPMAEATTILSIEEDEMDDVVEDPEAGIELAPLNDVDVVRYTELPSAIAVTFHHAHEKTSASLPELLILEAHVLAVV